MRIRLCSLVSRREGCQLFVPGQIDQFGEDGGGAMDAVSIWSESNVRTTVPAVAFEGECELDARHLRHRCLARTGREVRRLVDM